MPGRTIRTVKAAIECYQLTLILLSHRLEIDLLLINHRSMLAITQILGRTYSNPRMIAFL
jgi:hypothetical protein